jgi:hypothetical protein
VSRIQGQRGIKRKGSRIRWVIILHTCVIYERRIKGWVKENRAKG